MKPRLFALLFLALTSWGCSSQCPQVRDDYSARLASEAPFVARDQAEAPTHFGITMRSAVLNRIVQLALNEGLNTALDITDTITLASSQTLSVKTDGAAADLAVYADKACDTCLRVAGKLDGQLSVKLPVLPIQKVPLTGSFSLVAPIEFARNTAGKSEIQLNLKKMAEIGKSSLDAEIAQLPPTWSNVLRAPVSQKLMAAVVAKLGNVSLFEFNGPNLGIEGFEVFPTTLKTQADKGLIYLGFGSNLASEAGVDPVFELGAHEDTAFQMAPGILLPAIQAGLKAAKVPRRYDSDGKSMPQGPMHVTMGAVTSDATTQRLGFRLSNLPDSGQCYWVDAQATTSVKVQNDKLSVQIDAVELKDSSLPGVVLAIANWTTSAFLEEGKTVVEKSLSADVLAVPGSTTRFKGVNLRSTPKSWVFGGKLLVTPAQP